MRKTRLWLFMLLAPLILFAGEELNYASSDNWLLCEQEKPDTAYDLFYLYPTFSNEKSQMFLNLHDRKIMEKVRDFVSAQADGEKGALIVVLPSNSRWDANGLMGKGVFHMNGIWFFAENLKANMLHRTKIYQDATDKRNNAGFRMDREKDGIRNFELATQSGNGRKRANSGLSRDAGRQFETFGSRVYQQKKGEKT